MEDTAAGRMPAIRVIMMPKDTNAMGTIFGGVILSYIDQAGAVEAHKTCAGRIVTVAMREVVEGAQTRWRGGFAGHAGAERPLR